MIEHDDKALTRVAVLESRVNRIEAKTDEISTTLTIIKEQLAKNDGILPRIVTDLNDLKIDIKTVALALATKTTAIAENLVAKNLEDVKIQTKFNILWSLVACLATAIIVGVVGYIFHVRL